ncbi:MAG: PIN domain-containing protein, partial [Gammaproteobacteria bacterium]|nr:PIN domain-containing protein [Gammaproteobacteria bacterium]
TPPCRDPHDVPFLELALVGRADLLVTGDRDLLGVESSFACPIVTAADFLLRLAQEP